MSTCNSKLLINDIVMRIVMCPFCHSKFSYTTETLVHSVHMILIPSLLVNQPMTHTETHATNIHDNCLNIWYLHGYAVDGAAECAYNTYLWNVNRPSPLCALGFLDPSAIADFLKECLKVKAFVHPHVMGILGICLNGQTPYIVMPFMANGNLHTYLRKHRIELLISEDEGTDLVQFIALQYSIVLSFI